MFLLSDFQKQTNKTTTFLSHQACKDGTLFLIGWMLLVCQSSVSEQVVCFEDARSNENIYT